MIDLSQHELHETEIKRLSRVDGKGKLGGRFTPGISVLARALFMVSLGYGFF